MAKSKNNTLLIVGGLVIVGGAIGLYIMGQQKAAKNRAMILQLLAERNVPRSPASNAPQAIASWVQSIMSIYGNVAPLWQPGGPFYKPDPQIKAALDALKYVNPARTGI